MNVSAAYCQVVGILAPGGGAETEVQSCIAVCEKHVITALWDIEVGQSQEGAVVAGQFSEPARTDQETSNSIRFVGQSRSQVTHW